MQNFNALIVMIGAPGAGKTTFLEKCGFLPYQISSLDEERGRVCNDPGNQEATRDAVILERVRLGMRCRRGLMTAIDSTNVDEFALEHLLGLAGRYRMFTVAVVLDTPKSDCHAQNEQRDRVVKGEVVDEIYARFLAAVGTDGPVPGFAQTRRISPTRDIVYGDTPAQLAGAPWLL